MKRWTRYGLCTALVATTMATEPVPATPRQVVSLYDYQRKAVEQPDRFTWNNWSRQTGKSFAFSLRRMLRGLKRRRNQIFLSASERQSRELMMKARQHAHAMRIAASAIDATFWRDTSITQLEITLPNDVRIIGLPANPMTCRGFTGDVFLDEFAMHAHDREIWAGVFPTITRGRGELDVASTPKGKQNMFYGLASSEHFAQQTVTIFDAIAGGLDVDAEELRAGLGDEEIWRQEYLCEFVDETTAFLTYEMIAECENDELATTEVHWGDLETCKGDLYCGMDIGRRKDLTVIWILMPVDGRLITRGVIELRKTPFREQFVVLSKLLCLPAMRRCCIDASGLGMQLAESAVESFGPHCVEPITFTPAAKSQLAGGLRIKVEDKAIVIPVSAAIRDDWHAIVRDVTSLGHVRFMAERTPDGHSDRFWAAALAVHAAGKATGPAEAFGGGPLTFGKGDIL